MSVIVEKALNLWSMEDADYELFAARENQIYRVIYQGNVYALRLHRKGLRDILELKSELAWMAHLSRSGLSVPRPIVSNENQFVHEVDGYQIDLLTWLSGAPLGKTGQALDHAEPEPLFFQLGKNLAQLHQYSDDWNMPADFKRWAWDIEGLLGNQPLWGDFTENPSLSHAQKEVLIAFKKVAIKMLKSTDLDYGLIHADLVRENVMVEGDQLHFIDFDDAGFGYRLFDVATALIKNRFERNYDVLKTQLIDGYQSIRRLDLTQLDLFMALRAVTYVGWIMDKMDEDGAALRNERFIQDALYFVEQYLNNKK